jgi:protein-disulfide isomerase
MGMAKAKTVEIIEPKNIWVGNPEAPVSLVMYVDYENEDCAKANEAVNQLKEAFEDKLKINLRHFPLTKVNQRSHKAAEAVVGAGQEGKIWEMNNLLFAHRRNLGTISLKEYAREAGVTSKNFLNDLVNSVYGWSVRNDLLEALDKGVRDVPAFFINGERYQGKPTFTEMRKHIEPLLNIKPKAAATSKKRA